jgi:hypothetical protein
MRKTLVFAAATLICLTAAGGVLGATKLTSKNSVKYKLYTASTETFKGVNCGTTATIVRTLPTGSTGAKVVEPKVGDRDGKTLARSGTQISAINVSGTTITLSAVANGPLICDPEQTGVPAGDPVYWQSDYHFEADYSRRIPTVIRVYYESYLSGAKWKTRPKTIQDSRKGSPSRVRSRYVNLKWKSFGGKTAIATGRSKLGYCRAGDPCPDNNAPTRLVASKPRYCKDSGQFEYLYLNVYIRGHFSSGIPITCSP